MLYLSLVILGVVCWGLPCLLIAHWADKWGHRGWVWLLVALLISPLLAALIVLMLGKDEKAIAEVSRSNG